MCHIIKNIRDYFEINATYESTPGHCRNPLKSRHQNKNLQL